MDTDPSTASSDPARVSEDNHPPGAASEQRAARFEQAEWFDAADLAMVRSRGGAKWSKYGPEVLAAWVADMDFPPAPPVSAAINDVLARGALGYPWLMEDNPVARGFAEWTRRRYGWEIDPEMVVTTVDVLQPIQALINLFSEPGDGVVLQTPIYPPFHAAITEVGRVIVENRLGSATDGYPMDVDGLAALTAAPGDRTRIVLLCNPHNPSGRVFRREELEALGTLAVERGWLVISDEIHADLLHPGSTHLPFASLSPAVAARTVTVTSSTKTFNIAGLRLAVAHFGSPELLERYRSISRFMLGGANIMGVAASLAAWRDGERWLEGLNDYLTANRQLVMEAVATMRGLTTVAPEATYLAWLDCRELLATRGVANAAAFFLEHGVGLNDGADFGTVGEGFVRLNFATSRDILGRILAAMTRACNG